MDKQRNEALRCLVGGLSSADSQLLDAIGRAKETMETVKVYIDSTVALIKKEYENNDSVIVQEEYRKIGSEVVIIPFLNIYIKSKDGHEGFLSYEMMEIVEKLIGGKETKELDLSFLSDEKHLKEKCEKVCVKAYYSFVGVIENALKGNKKGVEKILNEGII